MSPTRTLFRPVGLKEGELILKSDSLCFPPRLPGQPIFYPVLNQEYAAQIAREWNAPKEPHFAGFVTRFEVDSDYAGRFEERVVGSSRHRELWVPAEQLDEFNRHIRGSIEFVEAHYGPGYRGPEPAPTNLKGRSVEKQLKVFADLYGYNGVDFSLELMVNKVLVQLNFAWWLRHPPEAQELDPGRKETTIKRIVTILRMRSPKLNFIGRAEVESTLI